MIYQSRKARLVIFAALVAAARVSAADSEFAGKVGARAERVATQGATYYPYGIYGNLEYRGFDVVVPYAQLRHTQNRRIFDGLGNTETIGVTDFMLGADWEISPRITLDSFYRGGLGTNAYHSHEGSTSLIFSEELFEITSGLAYTHVTYVFPGTDLSVLNTIITPEAEISLQPVRAVAIPLGLEYSAMSFSSTDRYGLFLAHAGVDWKVAGYLDWINRLNFGRDSSDYAVIGFLSRTRFKLNEDLRLSLWIDYIRYSKKATTAAAGQGKRRLTSPSASSAKTNPLGTTDSFSYFTLGAEISYAF